MSYIETILLFACIMLISVMGVYLITGLLGLFSFGQASFMALGAYAAGLAVKKLHFSFPLAMVAGILVAMVAALLIGSVTLRLRRDFFSLVTLGFGEAIAALLNYFVETHLKDGYEFMLPPHLLTYECGLTAGQFPKFEDDVYRLTEEGFRFLLPTAETALINLYRDEILDESMLPRKLFAYTPCYRREAGTYRASERGMIRGHQFNKIEMFQYTRPEDSTKALHELIDKACALVEGLGLHYRLSKLAAGDCSASMATTYDIELWLPSMNEYKECSSVSNARDYQARRGNIRFRRAQTKKIEYVHTLNGSGLATSRLMPAIVEQFQQGDGSVVVPEVLRKYTGFDVIR